MDSLSQIALGAAVSVAVMGRRSAVWKAALWGAVAGTLPDLDVLLRHGNPVHDMVLHRGHSHALLWLALAAPLLAGLPAVLHRERALWPRWAAAMALALLTHPLLDAMTVYGTRLGLPFTDHPFGVGSIFIIDPLYTLPLLLGCGWALARRGAGRALAVNLAGLLLSTAYLGWGMAAQRQVEAVARASLAAQGIVAERLLVTPTPFNSLVWRVVALEGERYHEGYRALLDRQALMHFDAFPRGLALAEGLQGLDALQRVAAFSQGFYRLELGDDGRLRLADLRMGQEPTYFFTFVIAERHSALRPVEPPLRIGMRPDAQRWLPWLVRRALGEPLAPPR
ncbi:MAG: metal-dependent hydrolase [Burkholderiaceae bacterium]|nr:metal-dependent hydrolase [Burkholderiaceae bacterium]